MEDIRLSRECLDEVLRQSLERLHRLAVDQAEAKAVSTATEGALLKLVAYIETDRPGGVSVDPSLNIYLEGSENG